MSNNQHEDWYESRDRDSDYVHSNWITTEALFAMKTVNTFTELGVHIFLAFQQTHVSTNTIRI